MIELHVDWPALHSAFQMNMPEVRCFLSLQDGRVLKVAPGDAKLAAIKAQSEHYMAIEAIPSRIQYQWVEEFVREMENTELRPRMEAAINGKGAFRRFKDILLTLPDERRRWFEFRDEKMRQRVIDWVREKGVIAVNEPEWDKKPRATGNNTNETCKEALRDFLIDWFDGKDEAALQPMPLEELAAAVSEKFKVTQPK